MEYFPVNIKLYFEYYRLRLSFRRHWREGHNERKSININYACLIIKLISTYISLYDERKI